MMFYITNKFFIRSLFAVNILLLCSFSGFSQFRVKGKISDEKGESLVGVNVMVKNTSAGTLSGIDGSYSIEVADNQSVLVFSYVGYGSKEIGVNGMSEINVVLNESAELLDEIVVIGYGSQRKSDLTGVVSSIKSEDLQKVASANITQALQGKIAGVQVVSGSGRPGEAPIVRIRGTGTLNGASPIYVVDGLILDNIDFLNATDIASMEVLKDASAAAIYGTRGANGVIIITTRQGSKNTKAQIRFNAWQGVQQPAKLLSLTNASEYGLLVNELSNRLVFANPGSLGQGTDWQNEIYRNAAFSSYNLQVSGGSDQMTYSISGDAFLQDGIIKSSYFNRYSLRINNTYQLASFVKIGHNISFVQSAANREPGGIVFNAYAADPTAPAVDADGNFGNTSTLSNVSNPAAQLKYNAYNRSNGQQMAGNAFIDVNPLKNLTLKSSIGFNSFSNKSKSFEPQFFVNDKQQNPESRLFVGNSQSSDWQWENTAVFQKDFKQHRLTLLTGYTVQSRQGEFMGGSRNRLIGDTEDFYYLNAGDAQTATNYQGASTPERYESYLFRSNYAFKDKYLLTVSFRRDGSSKFGSEKRGGNFPSLAFAWRAKEESFLKNVQALSNLKFRASWGILGNDKIPTGAAIPTVTNNLSAVFGPDEALIFGASLVTLANPFLQWEQSRSLNGGFDIGFLDNRLTAEVDVYHRLTTKILVPVPIPDYVGSAGNPYVNAADVVNKGLDVTLNFQNKEGKLNYKLSVLGSFLDNNVISLGSTGNALRDVVINGDFATLTQPGYPIGSFFGYKVAGIYQNAEDIKTYPNNNPVRPGDLRFEDINADGIINAKDRTWLGSPIPTFNYGFNLELSYSGFDFNADFNGVYGNKILNAKKMFRGFGIPNFETSFLNRWNKDNLSNTDPRITNGGYPNFVVSDHFLEDGSFFRLRTLGLGYTLADSLVKKLGIRSLRIYGTANNLFTWTKYSGYTPEVGSENVLQVGIDRGIYPLSKTLVFGIQCNF
jgi:TonB-linked SusC/RagA family outer membrane protein